MIGFLKESASFTDVHVLGVTPATAALTDLETAVFDSTSGTLGFTYEPNNHRVHGLINGSDGNIFTYDVATEAGSSSPVISAPNGVLSISFLEADRKTGKLYCYVRDDDNDRFIMEVNPVTGVSTTIGSAFDLAAYEVTLSINSQDGVGYFAGRTTTMGSSDRAVFTVNLATGAVSQSPDINFSGFAPSLLAGFHGLVAIDPLPASDLRIKEVTTLGDQSVRIRFQTTPGKSYRVKYKSQLNFSSSSSTGLFPGGANQQTAVGSELEWIDSGPPATSSHPSSDPRRFYVVEEL
jgi:hypothetical protein